MSDEKNILNILTALGEDPSRDGLKNTPDRVVRSWKELYSGYGQKPEDIFTVFESDHKQMVILQDIEIYSMCEHHMLPFFGKAHVAYIPDGKKIVGISKLARLVDIYARRLQTQERICQQVTDTLQHLLSPEGAACIIEADHMCIRMRGVAKQNSVMKTSSVTGVFLEDPSVRQELLNLLSLK